MCYIKHVINLSLVYVPQTNTYEGIVITNGQQSYALFTYQCGRMEWSGGATIGFNAAGNFYRNHHFSGANARNIACIKTPVTNLIYQLSKFSMFSKFCKLNSGGGGVW